MIPGTFKVNYLYEVKEKDQKQDDYIHEIMVITSFSTFTEGENLVPTFYADTLMILNNTQSATEAEWTHNETELRELYYVTELGPKEKYPELFL